MKKVKPYTYFSKIYSHLMDSVDYAYWAKYLSEIHQTIGKKNDSALELGSGNGKLSLYLKNEFKSLYLSDLSSEMLQEVESGYDKVCCDMLKLPFNKKFDFIFSAFDSINYLSDELELSDFFGEIANYLSKKGYFTFDVSLQPNSIRYEKDLNRSGYYNGIKFHQLSKFDEFESIHTNTIHFETVDGKKYQETHIQKIYDFSYYFEVIENSDLVVAECFDAFSFRDGSPESDRLQFIVKRIS